MAPYPQIFSRDTTIDDGSNSNPVTPEVVAGIVFACAILLGLCIWLGSRYYRMRTRQPSDIIVKGMISEGDEKAIPPKCVSLSLAMRYVPFVETNR
jgi:hypothetical protein